MTNSANKFWTGKVAVVTGGTAGLGLEIARQFASRGAHVGIIARDPERLAGVIEQLRKSGIQAHGVSADVCQSDQADRAIKQLTERLGRIDFLVNNVGVSSRHDIRTAVADDYVEAFRFNVVSAINCTCAATEEIRRRGGSIVNIASLAAKTAWPFMAPYSASKSALAAYTHQLRMELDPAIHVLLVCPGPIQRDDAGQRYAGQTQGLSPNAAKPGAGAKLRGLVPARLASDILRSIERRKSELVRPNWARLAFALGQISPRLGDWILRRFGAGRPIVISSPDSKTEPLNRAKVQAKQTVS